MTAVPPSLNLNWRLDGHWLVCTEHLGFNLRVDILPDPEPASEYDLPDPCPFEYGIVSAVASLRDVELASAGIGGIRTGPGLSPCPNAESAAFWCMDEAVADARLVLSLLMADGARLGISPKQ